MTVLNIWDLYLSQFRKDKYADDSEYAYFWGMLAGTLPYIQESDICKLIDHLLDIKKQAIGSLKVPNPNEQIPRQHYTGLCVQSMKVQCALMLIMLENRFMTENIKTKEIALQIQKLKIHGDGIFLNSGINILTYTIEKVIKSIPEQIKLKTIIQSLYMDEKYKWHRCNVNSCIDILL